MYKIILCSKYAIGRNTLYNLIEKQARAHRRKQNQAGANTLQGRRNMMLAISDVLIANNVCFDLMLFSTSKCFENASKWPSKFFPFPFPQASTYLFLSFDFFFAMLSIVIFCHVTYFLACYLLSGLPCSRWRTQIPSMCLGGQTG